MNFWIKLNLEVNQPIRDRARGLKIVFEWIYLIWNRNEIGVFGSRIFSSKTSSFNSSLSSLFWFYSFHIFEINFMVFEISGFEITKNHPKDKSISSFIFSLIGWAHTRFWFVDCEFEISMFFHSAISFFAIFSSNHTLKMFSLVNWSANQNSPQLNHR